MSPADGESAAARPSRLRRWLIGPVIQQLTQGTSPGKIAEAIAWGLTLGIFPLLGSTTLLSFLFGVPLRLNQPVLQAFKTLAGPLQWSLLLVFYRAGERLFDAPHLSIHVPTMIGRFFEEPGPFLRDYGMTACYGICVWCLVAPVLLIGIRRLSQPVLERWAARLKRPAAAGCTP